MARVKLANRPERKDKRRQAALDRWIRSAEDDYNWYPKIWGCGSDKEFVDSQIKILQAKLKGRKQ